LKIEVKKKMNEVWRAMVYQSHNENHTRGKISSSREQNTFANSHLRAKRSNGLRSEQPDLLYAAMERSIAIDHLCVPQKFIVFAVWSIYNQVANLRGSMINGGFR
jgi:hypothetical protein